MSPLAVAWGSPAQLAQERGLPQQPVRSRNGPWESAQETKNRWVLHDDKGSGTGVGAPKVFVGNSRELLSHLRGKVRAGRAPGSVTAQVEGY